jgi:hypothetical protein
MHADAADGDHHFFGVTAADPFAVAPYIPPSLQQDKGTPSVISLTYFL